MKRTGLTILCGALGVALLVAGIVSHEWFNIALGAALVVLAALESRTDREPRPPAKNWSERVRRYFGLG